jgi:hypothetical protein
MNLDLNSVNAAQNPTAIIVSHEKPNRNDFDPERAICAGLVQSQRGSSGKVFCDPFAKQFPVPEIVDDVRQSGRPSGSAMCTYFRFHPGLPLSGSLDLFWGLE